MSAELYLMLDIPLTNCLKLMRDYRLHHFLNNLDLKTIEFQRKVHKTEFVENLLVILFSERSKMISGDAAQARFRFLQACDLERGNGS